jgi:hypothetical protein
MGSIGSFTVAFRVYGKSPSTCAFSPRSSCCCCRWLGCQKRKQTSAPFLASTQLSPQPSPQSSLTPRLTRIAVASLSPSEATASSIATVVTRTTSLADSQQCLAKHRVQGVRASPLLSSPMLPGATKAPCLSQRHLQRARGRLDQSRLGPADLTRSTPRKVRKRY